MCFWNGYGFSGWFAPAMMMLVMVVFVAAVVLPFLRNTFGGNARGAHFYRERDKADDEALAIARRRYANGEISKDEFEEIRRTLS